MQFDCIIPQTRRAFEIPGTKSEMRVTFELGEDQVPNALRLVLMRGQLFKMQIQAIEENTEGKVKKIGDPLFTYGAISSRDSAIKINGLDGMTLSMSIPALDEITLVKMLSFREQYLRIIIPEEKTNGKK